MRITKFFLVLAFVMIGGIHHVFAEATLADISLKFCNNGLLTKDAALQMKTEKPAEVCIEFSNRSKDDAIIKIGFVDGVKTNDSDRKKACQNEGTNEYFGRYISLPNNIVTLPGRGRVRMNATVLFPLSKGGEINGCLTYMMVSSDKKAEGQMLDIIIRKASFIDIDLSGKILYGIQLLDLKEWSQETNITNKNFSSNKKVKIYKDEKSGLLTAEYALKNMGTVSQSLTVTGEMKDIFGMTIGLSGTQRILSPNQSMIVQQPLGKIPFYEGLFKIHLIGTYGDENLISGIKGQFIEDTNILLIPSWLIIVICALILVVCIFLIKNMFSQHKTIRRRKHK